MPRGSDLFWGLLSGLVENSPTVRELEERLRNDLREQQRADVRAAQRAFVDELFQYRPPTGWQTAASRGAPRIAADTPIEDLPRELAKCHVKCDPKLAASQYAWAGDHYKVGISLMGRIAAERANNPELEPKEQPTQSGYRSQDSDCDAVAAAWAIGERVPPHNLPILPPPGTLIDDDSYDFIRYHRARAGMLHPTLRPPEIAGWISAADDLIRGYEMAHRVNRPVDAIAIDPNDPNDPPF